MGPGASSQQDPKETLGPGLLTQKDPGEILWPWCFITGELRKDIMGPSAS